MTHLNSYGDLSQSPAERQLSTVLRTAAQGERPRGHRKAWVQLWKLGLSFRNSPGGVLFILHRKTDDNLGRQCRASPSPASCSGVSRVAQSVESSLRPRAFRSGAATR